LEEQIAAARRDRQIADLVYDQQREAAKVANLFSKRPFAFGPRQRRDDVGKGGEVDAATGFDRFDPERQAEMGFPRAGRGRDMAPGFWRVKRRSTMRSILWRGRPWCPRAGASCMAATNFSRFA
jgi:hypothetical protein